MLRFNSNDSTRLGPTQTRLRRPANRFLTSMGFVCLLASFLLMSSGVQTVRADGPAALAGQDEPNMSIDPALEAKLELNAETQPEKPVAPIVSAQDKAAIERAGVAGYEVAPGVVVLNTEGYNYAPRQGSLDPKALAQEAARPQ